jgi:hypothetical protein
VKKARLTQASDRGRADLSASDADSRALDRPLFWDPAWTERFEDRIRRTERHWLWTGYVDQRDGYGRFKPSHEAPAYLAHRLAYVRWVGPIPDEAPIIDHMGHPFNLRHCVRPECLEAITHAENIRRGISPAGINARRTHCPRCGSEYNDINTLFRSNGERRCRVCLRKEKQRYRARQKAAAAQVGRSAAEDAPGAG